MLQFCSNYFTQHDQVRFLKAKFAYDSHGIRLDVLMRESESLTHLYFSSETLTAVCPKSCLNMDEAKISSTEEAVAFIKFPLPSETAS